jgi:hypothetical protein
MARAKSIILTPQEKKAAVVDLKAKIKSHKDEVKAINSRIKEKTKLHDAGIKEENKRLAAVTKTLGGFQADLTKLVPAPAV